jgi:formyltetrahydrofolate hydrolase
VSKKDSPEKVRAAGQKQEAKVLAKACELYSKDKLYLHWGKVYFK